GHEPGEQKKVFHALQKAIQTGRISVQRLDEAVWRVLTIKIKYEVCDNPFPKKSQFSQLAAAQSVQIAREVAEKSITLVKDDPGILPFSGKEIIPFIWPSDFQDRLTPLLAACPFLQAHLLPLEATPEDVSRMVEACRQSDTVVIGSYDLIRYPAWQDLIRNLPGKHVVLIAMRSPYDLLKAPQVSTYLATYGDRPVSIEALGKFLRGEILPNGHLPVELPGLYSRGWGLVSFISRPQVQK
ncbi:MAG: hypothetical protein NTX88_02305, partial [Candidatus Atribacteria bacterium]|nr:hypothetical protein [Candidatus Atribacteria bacterium]